MRRLLGGLLVGWAIVACGGKDSTSLGTGTLVFEMDVATCSGLHTVELFIDGASKGQFTFAPGTRKPYLVAAGVHVLNANEVPVGLVWPDQSFNVPSGGTLTLFMLCA